MSDQSFRDQATIHIWTCDCGNRSLQPGNCRSHPYPLRGMGPPMTERVYVDLAALDPEALARKFEEERVASLEVKFLRESFRWLGLGGDDAS